jgi:hypothetical protein
VTLESGAYGVEWFDVGGREKARADDVTVSQGSARFTSPFPQAGPAVLYLKKIPVKSA